MLISVVIPAYNAGNFISKAIESVLNQTYSGNYEIVVVDDGSTDDTAEKINRFSEPVRYVHQENKGESGARNTGIEHAKGEWIAFLDADDEYLPNALDVYVTALNSNPEARAISAALMTVYPNGESKRSPIKNIVLPEGKDNGILDSFIRSHNQKIASSSSVFIKKSVFEEIGGFNTELFLGPDTDMWCRIGGNYPWCFVDKEVSQYIIRDSSVMQVTKTWERPCEHIWDEKQMKKYILPKSWPDYRIYRREHLLRMAHDSHSQLRFKESKKYLQKISPAPISLRWILSWFVTYIPGGSLLFRATRSIYRILLK